MSAMDIVDTAGDLAWDFATITTYTATAADNSPWRLAITGAAPPTAALANVSGGIGELLLSLEATSQAQILCIYQGDVLQWDIDDIIRAEFRVKMGQAGITSGSTLSFGLASARNDTYTSATALAAFSLVGATSTTVVYAETDDNVTDTAPVSTGKTLVAAYKTFAIDFSNGKSDVRFYVDGQRVCESTTFTMAGYSSGLQPYFQLQKAANTNADTCTLDYARIIARRPVA